ncbi:MAG: hypothetical protein ISR65_08830 [Bacteriovoracaceae bacterium]|nr:hypothetical protein [Bacteriovoracaceae bacterium]
MKAPVTLLVLALIMSMIPNLYAQEDFKVSASVQTKAFWQSQTEEADVDYSNLSIKIGKGDLNSILRDFGFTRRKVDFVLGLSMKFSIAPTLMEDSTRETLMDKTDAKLAYARQGLLAQIEGELAGVPAAIADTIRPALVAQVDAALAEKRVEAQVMIDDRIDRIYLETTIQEVAIVGAKMMGHDTLLFIKAGKFKVENGPSLNEFGRSQMDSMRPGPTIASSATIANTGAINVGAVKALDQGQIRVDVYTYHDRILYRGAHNYIADVVSLDQAAFDEHQDWWKLNAALARVILRKPGYELYVSAGTTDDNNSSYSAGGLYRITKSDKVSVDYNRGDGRQFDESLSAMYAHTFSFSAFGDTYDIDLYGGYEWIEGAVDHQWANADDEREYGQAVLGLSVRSPKWTIPGTDLKASFVFSAEQDWRKYDRDYGDGKKERPYFVGGQFQVEYE